MKTTILATAAVAMFALSACSSAPKAADPFDTAISQSLGVMMGGSIHPNAGGVQ